jgi:hypothetical protein
MLLALSEVRLVWHSTQIKLLRLVTRTLLPALLGTIDLVLVLQVACSS